MIKGIIGILVVGCILYAIFGILGIIIPSIFFVAIIITTIIASGKKAVTTDQAQAITADWETDGYRFDAELDVGNIPMKIKYQTIDGSVSVRQVDVHKVAISNNKLYIHGLCHLRGEDRTFRVDRISNAQVYGKVVDAQKFFTELCKNNEAFNRATENNIISDSVILAEAHILTYIARLDGILQKKEKEMIVEYLIQRYGLSDSDRGAYINQLAASVTSPADFRSKTKSIEITDDLIDIAYKLAGSDPMKKGAVDKLLEVQKHQGKNKQPDAADLAEQAIQE